MKLPGRERILRKALRALVRAVNKPDTGVTIAAYGGTFKRATRSAVRVQSAIAQANAVLDEIK